MRHSGMKLLQRRFSDENKVYTPQEVVWNHNTHDSYLEHLEERFW